MSTRTCTDCGIPILPKVKRKGQAAPQPPVGRKFHGGKGRCTTCHSRAQRQSTEPLRPRARACDVEAALRGECECKDCCDARKNIGSDFDAGPSLPGRHGVRRWAS